MFGHLKHVVDLSRDLVVLNGIILFKDSLDLLRFTAFGYWLLSSYSPVYEPIIIPESCT